MDHSLWQSIFFLVTAELIAKSQVDGYVAGAPPESCDTMIPIHTGSGFDDCSIHSLCPTVTIVGVNIVDNMFEYNCSQNYTSEVLCLVAYTVQLSVSSLLIWHILQRH